MPLPASGRIVAALAGLVAVGGPVAGAPPQERGLPFAPPSSLPEPLDGRSRDTLLRWARGVLEGTHPADADPGSLPFALERARSSALTVSVFRPGERPWVGLGSGESVAAAFRAALGHLAARYRSRFGPAAGAGARIQVDRLGPFRSLGRPVARALRPVPHAARGLHAGEDGLWMAGRSRQVFLLPHELILQGLVRGVAMDTARLRAALRRDLGPDGAPPGAELYAFPTRAFAEVAPGEGVELSRAMPARPELTPQAVEAALARLLGHLARVQRKDGGFLYRFDPVRGSRAAGENFVRQAAVVMTVLEVAAGFPDGEAARRVGARGVRFLLETLRPRLLGGAGKELVPPPDREDGPSLGAVALYARALALAPDAGVDGAALRRARSSLGRALLYMQRPDGSWYQNLGQALRGEPPLRKPRFFPGEALLTLADLTAREPEGPWAAAMERSLRRELEDLERGGTFDHWTVQALARAARVGGDAEAARRAYRLALSFLPGQVAPGEGHPQDAGGFRSDGLFVTVVHSGCVGEALREARLTAWRFGLDPRPLDAALVRLGGYLATQQVRPGIGHLLRAERLARGGFPMTPGDWRQRIDVDGHAGRALLGVLEALHSTRPTPVLAEAVETTDRRLRASGI